MREQHKKLDYLFKNRNSPEYAKYTDKFGKFNLHSWLADNGFEVDENIYKINDFNFLPEHNLTSLQLKNIDFGGCDIQEARFSGSVLENCAFLDSEGSGSNFDGSHFKNSFFVGTKLSDSSFANCTFEDCTISYSTFTKCNFQDSTFFEKTREAMWQKRYDSYYRVDFKQCNFNSVTFKGVGIILFLNSNVTFKGLDVTLFLNHYNFEQCSMVGMKMQNVDFRAVRFNSRIIDAVFENITVYEPYERPNFILLGPSSNSSTVAMLRDSIIKNCDWRDMHFHEMAADGIESFGNNTMEGDDFGCASYMVTQNGKNETYTGNNLQRFMLFKNYPEKQVQNNYNPRRFLGFPCVNTDGGTQSNLQRGGVLLLYLVIITLGLVGLYKLGRWVIPRITSNRTEDDTPVLLEEYSDRGEEYDEGDDEGDDEGHSLSV